MNMNPDNQTLLLWLEDELSEDDQLRVDEWAADQPMWLAKRNDSRQWRSQMSRIMPHGEEVPYGDFFQSRLMRAIESSAPTSLSPVVSATDASPWRKFWLPASVAAAMVMGFIGGTQWQDKPQRATTLVTYTPAAGVKAEFFESSPAEGTVIVLNGIAALPDGFVSAETSSTTNAQQSDRDKEAATIIAP
jgi:hypothetical protein